MNNDVKLISISKPLIEGINSSEELIAYISRVSNPTNQLNTETSEKLINYLIKHKHWSPFEQIFLTLEITTTRTIARQMLRHRSAFFQEFSQRYAEPLLKDFIISEVRFQDKKNRQNSIEITDKEKEDNQSLSVLENEWNTKQKKLIESSLDIYRWAIENGIAKELARNILPEGLTPSKLYMSNTLRGFIHWIQTRQGKDTQKEHREIAIKAKEIILKEIPSLKDILEDKKNE